MKKHIWNWSNAPEGLSEAYSYRLNALGELSKAKWEWACVGGQG
jgi:hypothetical protein